MAEFAIEFLENEEGYFLMIEGAYIDKHSHNNNIHSALSETRSLIDTIDYLYKKAGRDTALIITADHETGDLQKATSKEEIDDFLYRSTDHTDTSVPLYAKNFSYDFGENPENTIVFEVCKYLLGV
jgi:alkaline phosphatase